MKVAMAIPVILFVLYLFVYGIQVPSSVEDPEFTFSTYPVINTILWLWILLTPFAVLVTWHSLYRDKRELSKDFSGVQQRHWITIGAISLLTVGLYPLWYLFARYRRTGNESKSSATYETSKRVYHQQENEVEQKESKENSREHLQKEAEVKSKYPDQQQERRELQKALGTIGSELREVDSLITSGEFQEAKELVDDIQSRLTSLEGAITQEGFGDLRAEVKRLESKADQKLSKPHVFEQFRNMDSSKFEGLVAKLIEHQGWEAWTAGDTTDKDIDVIAMKQDTPEKQLHFIQVKRYDENTKVESEDIKQCADLYDRGGEKPDAVFVVTSNRFSKEAKNVADDFDVQLVDCSQLYEMLAET